MDFIFDQIIISSIFMKYPFIGILISYKKAVNRSQA